MTDNKPMEASAALGMIEGRPKLVRYDARWPSLFVALRRQLQITLGHRALSIHHVGSTSVPGLRAKPILDVLIGVKDLTTSLADIPALASLGFEYGPEDDIAERHYFRGRRNGLRTHHISMAEQNSAHFINALIFRDALRASSKLAHDYEALKLRLIKAHEPGQEIHRGKSEFIGRVLVLNGGVLGDRVDGVDPQ